MFELSKDEWQELITNCDNLENLKYSQCLPYVFTEQGVAMISEIYHIGASLKDLGKKWFAFSKMDIEADYILKKVKQ